MDIMTGVVVWAMQAITFSLLMLLWWFRERQDVFKLSWSCGFFLLGTGLLFVGLRDQLPSFLSVEIANALMLAAIGILVGGMQQFDGRRLEPHLLIPVLLWTGGMLLPFVRENFTARAILYNFASSVGFAMFIAILLYPRSKATFARCTLAVILGLQIAASLGAALLVSLSSATSFGTVASPALVLLPGAICFIAAILAGTQMMAERAEDKLKLLAITDPLTGVLNRRGVVGEFDRLRTQMRNDKPLLALLHFDLDNFKQINDRCGHQVGDAVLTAFCRLAALSFRGRGTFGRMGGEEFACILRVADVVEAASIAEGIRMTLALQTITTEGQSVNVTVSAGIAVQTTRDANLDQLLTSADRALYTAKASGRNCTALDQPGGPEIVPSASMLSQHDMAMEIQASEQVVALRRISKAAKA